MSNLQAMILSTAGQSVDYSSTQHTKGKSDGLSNVLVNAALAVAGFGTLACAESLKRNRYGFSHRNKPIDIFLYGVGILGVGLGAEGLFDPLIQGKN